MLDRRLARLAFRARAAQLVVATTGSATLAATATGYSRSSGSFITDGFERGMEVTPAAFTQTDPGIIDLVTASALTIRGGRTPQTSGAGRSLTVGLPALRAWENVKFEPTQGRPYVDEDLVMGGGSVLTLPTRTGLTEQDGLSIWTWFGLAGMGPESLDRAATALTKLFAPNTKFVLSDGSVIVVRGDVLPHDGQITPVDGGWAYVQVSIPWRVTTRNAVAA